MRYLAFFLIVSFFNFSKAQEAKNVSSGTLQGVVKDKNTGELLVGATIQIVGTYNSAATDLEGAFTIKNIKPGDYSIKISYVGYADKQYNGIKIKEGEPTELKIDMVEASQTLGEVVIEGDKNLVDLESGKSSFKVVAEDIKEMNMRDVQQVAAIQPGVSQTTDGLQVRGGRSYETQYLVDGISAVDPLAGNGGGVGLGSGSIQEVNVITGNAGAEYSDAVSGVVAAKIKEGSNKFRASGGWTTDNVNAVFPKNSQARRMGWNTDFVNINLGGAFVKDKLFYFSSFDAQLTDDYTLYPNGDRNLSPDTRFRANQLKSSLLDNPNDPNDFSASRTWAPRQDNRWIHTLKLSYNIAKGMKISVTNQHSLNINQNTRSLLVQGFDAPLVPGFQYYFSRNLDNATTYTQRTNLTAINFKYLFAKGWNYDLSLGRLFTNLRADANGRPFRPETIDSQLDPASIVTDPVTVFNPNGNVVFVNPGPGLANNGGISGTWHDHYFQEYTFNNKFTKSSFNGRNFLSFGWLHKEQEYQWVDVKDPWVGAPIVLPDGSKTPSISLGSESDVWNVNPSNGGLFISDEIRYKGIIANFGLRFSYWALGKYADDAVENPASPLVQTVRDQYRDQTVDLGKRYNARLLPSVEVKFPVTDNNVLFFNYSQSMRNEHPLFFYQGLNPLYSNNSFLGDVGNPALRPSVISAYEIGVKSQVTKNTAITFTAYYKDYFDYAKKATQVVQDRTGQFVEKQTYINQDYARIRGAEIVFAQRISNVIRTTLSATYQVATGKANSAYESSLQIKQQGFTGANKERYLVWDVPFESKFTFIFVPDSTWKIGSVPLKNFRVFISALGKTNQLRYTPHYQAGVTDYGRPIYLEDVENPNSKLGSPVFWADLKITRDIPIRKKAVISAFIEVKNIFDNNNAIVMNPVTGRGYEYGQQLPLDNRDPQYNNPQDNGTPPFNPARYMPPRQLLVGVLFNY